MATRIADIWTCSNCHNFQNKDSLWFDGDICEICHEKIREREEGRWHAQLDILHKLVGKSQNSEQDGCTHLFRIIPKSGRRFGVKLWACEKCEKVVQSS